MALIYLESFDKVDVTQEGSSHTNFENYYARRAEAYNFSGGSGPELFSDYAFGGNGYCFMFGDDTSADANYIEPIKMSGHATFVMGIAVKTGVYIGANGGDDISTQIMQWKNITDGVTHVAVNLIDGRHLRFERNGSTYLCHVRNALRPGIWQYLEIKMTCNNTTGSIVVKVNGVEILNETGLDTKQGTGADEFETIRLKGVDGASQDEGNTYFDDWYICDGSGSDNNDFLGVTKVESLLPDSDVTTEWGARDNTTFDPPTTISNRYDLLNAVPQADDDLYVVESASGGVASGDQETFGIENLSLLDGTIHGIKVEYDVRNTGSSDSFKVVVVNGANEDTSNSLTVADTNYGVVYYATLDLAPDGGSGTAFTDTIINSLVVGCEKP